MQHIRRPSSANVRKKKGMANLKIQNLKFIMCIAFNKVGPVEPIPRIKVHLSQGD